MTESMSIETQLDLGLLMTDAKPFTWQCPKCKKYFRFPKAHVRKRHFELTIAGRKWLGIEK